MRRSLSLSFAAFLVALILACGGGTAEPAPTEPPTPTEPDRPDRPDRPAKPTDEVVAAYLADCHHVFPPADDMGDGATDECTWREFDQNCSPDPHGCWDKGESCKDDCGAPCGDCQSTCGDTCDTCKADCGGDDACLTDCARTRSTCRDGCMKSKGKCEDKKCSKVTTRCYEKAEEKIAKRCPDCDAIKQCVEDAWSGGGDMNDCGKPGNAAECLAWCTPY